MEIKKLNSDAVTKLRSSSQINSFSQCVIELVLNSLDAKSTAVAVRVNPATLKVQVIDNGEGVSMENLRLMGLRHRTSKYGNSKNFGYRGESIANIVELSKVVKIVTKYVHSINTYSKNMGKHHKSEVILTKNRSSNGTTIIVEGFFHRFPVRRKRISPEVELNELKQSLKQLILMQPKISFSLKNDLTNSLIFDCPKDCDVVNRFKHIFPDEINGDLSLLKVEKSKILIEGMLFKEMSKNKKFQFLYVNRRPVLSNKMQKFINGLFSTKKGDKNHKYPVYIINIECPNNEFDLLLNSTKPMVNFRHEDLIMRCLTKLINAFYGNGTTNKSQFDKQSQFKRPSECGISCIKGAVKAFGYKKERNYDITEVTSNKTDDNNDYNIINDTPYQAPLPVPIIKKQKSINYNNNEQLLINDERKGKDLLLEMFLKSVKVFSSEESVESFYEVESNLHLENNVEMNVNGIKKTKSVSISVKSTRKINKRKVSTRNAQVQTSDDIETINNDYTMVLGDNRKFNFVSKDYQENDETPMFKHTCICSCHNGKIFDFSQKYCIRNCNCDDTDLLSNEGLSDTRDLEISEAATQTNFELQTKPIFIDNQLTFSKFNPKKFSTQNRFKEIQQNVIFNPQEESFNCFNLQLQNCSNDSLKFVNISEIAPKYSQCFEPIFKSQISKKSKSQKDHFQMMNEREKPESPFRLKSLTQGRNYEETIPTFNFLNHRSEEDIESENLPDNWIRRYNNKGNAFYFNTKTGNTLISTPHPISNNEFHYKKRLDLLPKGMSPIMKEIKPIETVLSQATKNILTEYIFDLHKNELPFIKWQNLLENVDAKIFFENIYKEKVKMYNHQSIPKLEYENLINSLVTFNKQLFNDVVIIGQVDRKFIAVKSLNENLLILFDQHAVDERVRLETLLKRYKNVSTALRTPLEIVMKLEEINLLKNNERYLTNLGFRVEYHKNIVKVNKIPPCLINKLNNDESLSNVIEYVLKEIYDLINETKCTTSTVLPKLMQNFINTEACRGAIKFGDVLSRKQCEIMLKNLSSCALPFQCAHGRPTLVPLFRLESNIKMVGKKPNLANIKKIL